MAQIPKKALALITALAAYDLTNPFRLASVAGGSAVPLSTMANSGQEKRL